MIEAVDLVKQALNSLGFIARIVRKWTTYVFQRARLRLFRLSDRVFPVMKMEDAAERAFGVLGGSIIKAIPYRNLGSARKCIAVLRAPSDKEPDSHAYILEGIAGTYRETFASEELYGHVRVRDYFHVEDVDGDGIKELIFGTYVLDFHLAFSAFCLCVQFLAASRLLLLFPRRSVGDHCTKHFV